MRKFIGALKEGPNPLVMAEFFGIPRLYISPKEDRVIHALQVAFAAFATLSGVCLALFAFIICLALQAWWGVVAIIVSAVIVRWLWIQYGRAFDYVSDHPEEYKEFLDGR